MSVLLPVSTQSSSRTATSKIFRHNLSDTILKEITDFSKIHQNDDRHAYKDAWNIWKNTHEQLIIDESRRLSNVGFTGDVDIKMFKAGRYYFSKKSVVSKTKTNKTRKETIDTQVDSDNTHTTDNTNTTDNTQKRSYVNMDADIIQLMDSHLKSSMDTENFKPENSFVEFITKNQHILQKEIIRLKNIIIHSTKTNDNNNAISKKISTKLKKTFKNRYFILSKLGSGGGVATTTTN